MSDSNNSSELAEDLAKSLKVTTTLMQSLLGEIRDNATSLAVLKQKLEGIEDKVNSLSHIIRSDNGEKSLITRVALMEKSIADIAKDFEEHTESEEATDKEMVTELENLKHLMYQDKKTAEEYRREKSISILKVLASVLPGLVALGIVIAKYFTGAE